MTERLLKESHACCEKGLHGGRMRPSSKGVPDHFVDLRWPEKRGLRTGSRPRQLCVQDKLAAMVVLVLCLASGTSSLGPSYNYNCSAANIVPLNLTEGVCCPINHNNRYFKTCSLVDAIPHLPEADRLQKSRVSYIELHKPSINEEGHIAGELSWMYLGIPTKIPTRGFLVTISFEGTVDGRLHPSDIFVKDCFLVPAKSNLKKVSVQLSTNCSKYPTFSCLESIVLREIYIHEKNTSPPKIRVEVKTIPWGTPTSTIFTLKTCQQLDCNTIVVQAGSKLQCHGSLQKTSWLLCYCNRLKPVDFDASYSMKTGEVTILWQMASDFGRPLRNVQFFRILITPFIQATSEMDHKNLTRDDLPQATRRKFVKYRPELRERSGFKVLMVTFDSNGRHETVQKVVQLPPPTEAPPIQVAASPRSVAANTTNPSSVNITGSSQPTAMLSSPSSASTHPTGREGDTNTSYIAASISLLLVMLAFVLTLLAVVLNNRWNRMPNKKKQPRNHCNHSNHSSTDMWWSHSESKDQGEGRSDTTSSVPVYISYARFLQQHRKDVRVFADLLRCGAHVDTILDMYCENEVAIDRVSWLNDSMQRSKFIIVVLSKHHSMLMDADLAKDTADDDDFVLCQMETKNIMSCLLRPEQEQEVIPVYFAPKPLPFKLPLCLGNCKVYYLGNSPSSSPDFLDLKYRLNGVEKLAPPV